VPRKSSRANSSDPLPFWSGTISFGLVSVPVDLYPAVRTQRVSMRQFGPGGNALKRRYFTEDGELLADDEIVRGYELDDGTFIVVTDEELEKLEPRKSRDIDLRRFVGRDEIPANLFERHYVLAPGGESTKAYHLLAEAMEREGRAGIATYVMRGREYLVAIYAERGLLFGATLRFVDQLRTPKSIGLPEVSAAPAKALKEVKAALKTCLADSLDTKLFVDEESDALVKLAERKEAKSRDLIEVEAGEDDDGGDGDDILDIMAILKQRMQGSSAPKAVGAGSTADGVLADLSKAGLYNRAKELDIPGRSGMSRADLEKAIKSAE
jgi:DNA end-binding protein Ku